MAVLYLHSREVSSVFQLLGKHENDITYSLAWALARCPSFLKTLSRRLVGRPIASNDKVLIRLQEYERDGGFTNVEIELSGKIYLIIEAKRGWNLPTLNQLAKYGRRLQDNKAPLKRFVVLSECSQDYEQTHLGIQEVAGVQVEHVSWKDILMLVNKIYPEGSHAEKRLLEELSTYLRGVVTMQNIDSNRVYVVAIASGTPPDWGISWIDIVKKRHRYFHPVGGSGWPKEPPNYIAFRYYGKLQTIHHIESYEIATNMHSRIPEIPSREWEPHFLYKLGPAFGPSKEVRTGKVYRNGRVWYMLDTLFTCNTISEARDLSKKTGEPTQRNGESVHRLNAFAFRLFPCAIVKHAYIFPAVFGPSKQRLAC